MDTTVLLLDNQAGGEDSQLQSLCHGVLLLERDCRSSTGRARRRLRVVWFHGVAATEGFHDFTINRGGIAVFPQIELPGQSRVSPEPVESGIAEMDRLVGGGLAWGTTTLFMGPSGSGKSTLATQYMAHAREPASIYLFDERMRTYLHRSDALRACGSRGRSGHRQMRASQIEPGQLSPGEFSHRVRRDVDEFGARMILIDSINGYLHAIPQSDAPLARMHELLSFLNERGVATRSWSWRSTASSAP